VLWWTRSCLPTMPYLLFLATTFRLNPAPPLWGSSFAWLAADVCGFARNAVGRALCRVQTFAAWRRRRVTPRCLLSPDVPWHLAVSAATGVVCAVSPFHLYLPLPYATFFLLCNFGLSPFGGTIHRVSDGPRCGMVCPAFLERTGRATTRAVDGSGADVFLPSTPFCPCLPLRLQHGTDELVCRPHGRF